MVQIAPQIIKKTTEELLMKKDYQSQASDNVRAFYDAEYTPRRELIHRIVNEFEKRGILWAVGCSFSLFLRGIVDDFHDFDIVPVSEWQSPA